MVRATGQRGGPWRGAHDAVYARPSTGRRWPRPRCGTCTPQGRRGCARGGGEGAREQTERREALVAARRWVAGALADDRRTTLQQRRSDTGDGHGGGRRWRLPGGHTKRAGSGGGATSRPRTHCPLTSKARAGTPRRTTCVGHGRPDSQKVRQPQPCRRAHHPPVSASSRHGAGGRRTPAAGRRGRAAAHPRRPPLGMQGPTECRPLPPPRAWPPRAGGPLPPSPPARRRRPHRPVPPRRPHGRGGAGGDAARPPPAVPPRYRPWWRRPPPGVGTATAPPPRGGRGRLRGGGVRQRGRRRPSGEAADPLASGEAAAGLTPVAGVDGPPCRATLRRGAVLAIVYERVGGEFRFSEH